MNKIYWKVILVNVLFTVLISTGVSMLVVNKLSVLPNIVNNQTSVSRQDIQITRVVSEISSAVVSIVERPPGSMHSAWINTEREVANGTGFIIDPNGYIVTNYHVLAGNLGDYYVVFNDKTYVKVDKIFPDEANDLAVLKIDKKDLPTLNLGDSDTVLTGTQVLAVGNAYGRFSNTVSMGIISGQKRSIEIPEEFSKSLKLKLYSNLIQTDASLNPGNSGGPLVDLNKNVIGINVASSWSGSVGFAIPVNNLKNILPAILKGEHVKRAYLGITAYPGGNVYKKDGGLVSIEGLAIAKIDKDSPAEKLKLQLDDIITQIDGTKLNSLNTLENALLNYKAGDKIVLTVYRKPDPKSERLEEHEATLILEGR